MKSILILTFIILSTSPLGFSLKEPGYLTTEKPITPLSVIDLTSFDLSVFNKFELPGCPTMAVTLPDDERVILLQIV